MPAAVPRVMSKRLAVLQALIMLMSLVVVSGFAAAQENETTIDTSVTWEADGGLLTCDYDHVRIMDGGVLTIRDALVDLTCNITVDEGGILNPVSYTHLTLPTKRIV